jgi:hypothetical protein
MERAGARRTNPILFRATPDWYSSSVLTYRIFAMAASRAFARSLLLALLPLTSLMAQPGGGRGSAGGLPLTPTRTVAFETNEGTWMSLDVSPDGSAILFELLGDLYTLPIGGGTATRLTSGPAMDAQPRYSPNGRQIVFVSDRGGRRICG